MNYGALKKYDIANGPGCRVSLFVSGCRNHCPGCFNQEAQDFNYGQEFTDKTFNKLMAMLSDEHIAGLSILGGDPFEPENADVVEDICLLVKIKYPDKDIWAWTGYYYEDLKDLPAMRHIDVLVDGPFIESQKNLCLAYCGSENQRVIDVQKSLAVGEVVLYHDDNMRKGLCV